MERNACALLKEALTLKYKGLKNTVLINGSALVKLNQPQGASVGTTSTEIFCQACLNYRRFVLSYDVDNVSDVALARRITPEFCSVATIIIP
eukprot:1755097-Pleurochrysis_carterae.AAC.1